jgi:osmotically-inducible protein OsmY
MLAKMKQVVDSELGQAVLSQIRQHPELDDTDLRVAADRGVVTLTGQVNSDAERAALEAAAKDVCGVEAIASELLVKASRERSDTDIARDALNALHNHILIPASDIMVIVRDGRVMLEGKGNFELQRMLAEAEVKRLRGIASISNQIKVEPSGAPEAKHKIEALADMRVKTVAVDDAAYSNDAWIEIGAAEPG